MLIPPVVILRVVSIEDIYSDIIKREDLCRDLVEKESVVADRDDSAVVFVERCFESFARRNVEMVRRLVEDQDVLSRIDQLRKSEPSLFAALKGSLTFLNTSSPKNRNRERKVRSSPLSASGATRRSS
jgi:hypothetical protein